MEEVRHWLASLKLSQYDKKFEERGYDDMEDIKSLSIKEIEKMITQIGIKLRHADKIRRNLSEVSESKSEDEKIVNNMDEVKDWLITLNLSQYAQKFEEYGYDYMEDIKTLSTAKVEKMITHTGMKLRHADKIREYLCKDSDSEVANQKLGDTSDQTMIIFKPGKMGMEFTGNVITSVVSDGQAYQLGVQCGWSILEVNGRKQPNDTDCIDKAIDKTYQLGQPTEILFKVTSDIDEVRGWLSTLNLSQYAQKFEECGYDDMEDIVSLSTEQIEKMIAQTGIKLRHADKIRENLKVVDFEFEKEKVQTKIKILYSPGTDIRVDPIYPGTKTGGSVPCGTSHAYTEKRMFHFNNVNISFYKLEGNRGWVHNYNPKNPSALDGIEEIVVRSSKRRRFNYKEQQRQRIEIHDGEKN